MKSPLTAAVLLSAIALVPTLGYSQTQNGIWINASELFSLPTSGPAWDQMKAQADADAGVPDLSNPDQSNNVYVLAKALVYGRTGIEQYRTDVIDQCMLAIDTELDGSTLALGRELAAYVIAADLVKLPPDKNEAFRAWLRRALTENLLGRTLQSTQKDRPNNWGTHAGASRAAVAAYLGDAAELARTAQVFKGWLGDRSAYAGFSFGKDLSWHCDPDLPFGVNPSCQKQGYSIDGVLPDDQRRSGSFMWPPPKENYVWEALQGAIVEAEILFRAGYDTYNWSDKALLRAYLWLHDQAENPAENDDHWQPHIVNFRYGTTFPAVIPARFGKNMGWTDWTFGVGRAPTEPAPPPITQYDLAVIGFTASRLSVLQGKTVSLEVSVANLGADVNSGNVTVTELPDGSNLGTQPVVSLASEQSATFSFFWNTAAASPGAHTLTSVLTLSADEDPSNNSKSTTVQVVQTVHDIAVTSVSAPASANQGETMNVTVEVGNPGGFQETFAVSLAGDPPAGGAAGTPSSSQTVTLAAGGLTTLTFTWDATGASAGAHTLTAALTLSADEDPSNNSKSTTVQVVQTVQTVHDIAVTSVSAPASANQGETVNVTVEVGNPGGFQETFAVSLAGDPPAGGAAGTPSSSQTVTLAAGGLTTLTFTWDATGASAGEHTLTATASTVVDETDTADNRKSALSQVLWPAPAVMSIAPNSMRLGTSIKVTVSGSNFAPGVKVSFENGDGAMPAASNISVVNSTTITATVRVKSGGPRRNRIWDVVITNSDGKSGALVDGFTVTP